MSEPPIRSSWMPNVPSRIFLFLAASVAAATAVVIYEASGRIAGEQNGGSNLPIPPAPVPAQRPNL